MGHMNGVCAIDKYNAGITQDYGAIYWTNDSGITWNMQEPTVASGGWLLSASAKSLEMAWITGVSQNGKEGILIYTINHGKVRSWGSPSFLRPELPGRLLFHVDEHISKDSGLHTPKNNDSSRSG